MNRCITCVLLAFASAPAVTIAAPIAQIECVYDGVPREVRSQLTAASVQVGAGGPTVQKAMEAAMVKCSSLHGWSEIDTENSGRYFMMRAISESSEKALPVEHVLIVQQYFSKNQTEFVGMANFLDADNEKIVADLTQAGIPATEEQQTEAALYLYWITVTAQLRADFAASKLRD